MKCPKTERRKIIVLSRNSGGQQLWQEIEECQLKKWMKDGSIMPGDRIVYAEKMMEVVEVKTLNLQESE